MIPDVIIIGGGLAGLSAALQLVRDGAKILLIEKNRHLGGRTYSFLDKYTNSVVDNGQHLLVGAYKNTLKYLEILGTNEYISSTEEDGLSFFENGELRYNFKVRDLFPPINFALAVLMLKPISPKDKLNLVKMALRIKKWDNDLEKELSPLTVKEFLNRYNQSEKARKYFWDPLVISIMNESPDLASALLFAKVLKNTYLSENENNKILYSKVGQTELYVDKALNIIEDNHSKILIGEKAERLLIKNNKVIGVETKKGIIESKSVIVAVPHFDMLKLLPKSYFNNPIFNKLEFIQTSPIISVNLWLDREIMKETIVGFINSNTHWVFNRNKIITQENGRLFYLTAVISNAHSLINYSKEKIVELVWNDLKKNFPKISESKLVYSVVLKEKRATISARPETENHRLNHKTEIENLFIAGDWTNTKLPATIESAITSGFSCAELVKKNG